MSNDLGFGKTAKLDLSGFAPGPSEKTGSRQEQEAAERAGFQSREPVERVRRIRKASEPLDQAFVRAPIDVINRFKQYCNETGMSYGEALDELMRKAGI
ncbi:hypothetical protein CN221_35990 [Sinorhizobium meliloti]|uniref:hypothetical protein n=1 Tax=Rhizobium meliloti TaxID=382 RepID=UPI0003DDD4AA|nr:hypothetical protein [Sinorhizobium meliloti]ARS65933.1 hypothetical protein SMRU11_00265 [Sinorhizobium meliloti RU11/001]RVG82550.1 hypothetical protein CN221_35990 [Sinorhizobium meliloti]RVH54431.1 hypothetical protein CN209_35750 [Sinorhizobium meliloti]